MDPLDLRMTLFASCRNILFVDAGSNVGVGQDEMGCVAGSADCGDRQTLLVEPLAVDTHGIVLEDLILPYLVGPGDLRALLMATSTKDRNVHHSRRGAGVLRALDVMLAMTISAARRQRITALGCSAMQAVSVLAALPWMASVAADGLIGERLDLVGAVAAGAGDRSGVTAATVILGLGIVAHAAIDRFDLLLVKVLTLQVGVTQDALEIAMK